MSLKAWAGLLGEFGRQSEAYASRQQELEDKRMEEERENRRLQALLAKEQALETWRANRPLSANEQEDREQKKKLVDAQVDSYKALAGQRESKTVSEADVDVLAAQLSEQNGGDMVMARAQARAMLSGGGGKAGAASGSPGAAGALKLGNADLFKDETIEAGDTTQTVRRYLNGAKVPNYSEDEFVQMATERANAWRKQKGKGLMSAEPSEEDTSAFMAEQLKALKEANAAQHKAAFEESKRVFSEFNAQPGLLAPQGKTGQPEAPGKQPSLADKIGKPNANATIDFEAALQSMRESESNNKDFTEKGEFVTSKKGAQGKSQVMPKTADDPGFGIKPADLSGSKEQQAAELNRVGKEYLSKMIEKYDGNLAIAYAAYNMGPGATDKWLKSGADPADLPKETRDYVGKAMAKYESYVSKKSKVLEGQGPQVAGEPENDLAARVKARAEQYRASAQQQEEKPEKKGLLAETQPDQRSLGTKAGEVARNMISLEGISEGQRRRAEAIKEKKRISDQQWAEMLEKSGKPIADFIRDFIKAYGGATTSQNKTSGRMPTDVTGVRG